MLRAIQLGIQIRDLDLLTVGFVNDLFCENGNDEHKYAKVATQADMDSF